MRSLQKDDIVNEHNNVNSSKCQSLLLEFGKDSLLYIPSYLLPPILGFFSLFVYTRIFSPKEYGNYILVISIVGIVGVFAYSWINQSYLRFFSNYKSKNLLDTFLSTCFFSLGGTLFFSSVLLLVSSKFSLFSKSAQNYITFTILLIVTTGLFETLITILRADRNPKTISLLRCLSSGFPLIISLIFIFVFNLRITSIFIGTIITNIILVVIVVIKYNFHRYISYSNFSKKLFKEFLSYGVPLTISGLFAWILSLSDRFLIEYFRGSDEVGIYSAVYQLVESPMLLISSIMITAAFPIIIDTWEKHGEDTTIDLISNVARYQLLFAVPIAFGISSLSSEIVLLLGESYILGSKIIPWVCLGSLILGISNYLNKGFELKRNTKNLSLIVGIAGICNIVMNLYFIPRYGFYGAGVSTFFAYLIYFLLATVISNRYLKLRINAKSVLNILIASIVMWLTIIIVKEHIQRSIPNLVSLVVLGICVYFFILHLTGEMGKECKFIKEYIFLRYKYIINN